MISFPGGLSIEYDIPHSVNKICRCSFIGCCNMLSVTIPNSVSSIGEYAFRGCCGLSTVSLPNSISEILCGTFESCTHLASVTIPNSVIDIGESSFSYCTNLNDVFIGNSVKSIGNHAFAYSGLKCLSIPNSVSNIGNYAFDCCNDLQSVILYDSVTEIGECAFNGCNIAEIFYLTSSPRIINCVDYVFSARTYSEAVLKVLEGGATKAKSSHPWNKFSNIIEISLDDLGVGYLCPEKQEYDFHIFDFQGRRYTHKIKGLNIINGRKYILK